MPTIVAVRQDSGAIDVTPKQAGQSHDDPTKMQPDRCDNAECNNKKCPQGTQTELWTISSSTDTSLVHEAQSSISMSDRGSAIRLDQ